MKIEDRGHMVIIWENFLDWYDEETDSIMDTAPVRFENGQLIEITDAYVAIEKEDGFVLQIVDGLGDVEKILSDELINLLLTKKLSVKIVSGDISLLFLTIWVSFIRVSL